MGFKIVTIPFDKEIKEFKNEIIEKEIENKNILNYKVELISMENEFFWTFFIEYKNLDGLEKVEANKEKKLTEAEEVLLSKLKEWRSTIAKEKGVPSYVVAKNEHLFEIIKKKPKTLQELKNINGIGEKKVKDYGEKILEILKNFYGENI